MTRSQPRTHTTPLPDRNPLRHAVRAHWHADEAACVDGLLAGLDYTDGRARAIEREAGRMVKRIRADDDSHGGLDAFLREFGLSSEEGVALMCLAESLLRVPDSETADRLIQDKLAGADWRSHVGESESFFVNASTWGLLLTGKVIALDKGVMRDAGDYIGRLIAKSGEPIIRSAVRRAMRIMGGQFVLAETIGQALQAAREQEAGGYCYSYDMLGEAARTAADAERYLAAYRDAIDAIGGSAAGGDPRTGPGISIKLSALHPRYEYMQGARVMRELYPRLHELCQQAAGYNMGLTIDAEEADRLDPSLSLLEKLCRELPHGWHGLGFAVQAYQKRAPRVLDWMADLAADSGRRLMVRLVKGAYWDTEIKFAQLQGYPGYPVYTRKAATDLSYLACARKLLARPDAFYPMFATHNAHTVAAVLNFAGERRNFEFQRLHGMGESLYRHVTRKYNVNCRIYAPVGPHRDLLAYLVRRLLENGANSSFVNRLVDRELPVARIVADPVRVLRKLESGPHPGIPLPAELYRERANSAGMNLADELTLAGFFESAESMFSREYTVACDGADAGAAGGVEVICPADGAPMGVVHPATENDIARCAGAAHAAAGDWDARGGAARARLLRDAADRYEEHRNELMALCLREAGKTLNDAIAEVREAVDFLRYYAQLAEREFAGPVTLDGPTGERNQLRLHGRGVFTCISPWNFPLAIFTGQVSAALAAGNAVLAKPAEQTPVIARRAVELLHHAGIPREVLHLLPGGAEVGAALVAHAHTAGVAFTGSTAAARAIQRTLAERDGPIVPLIAETGGLNAMIVDSTALPEQVTRDVVMSAFQSAGQRCSALRVLYLQEDVAGRTLDMIRGAMDELTVGDPACVDTDIGPIIDAPARDVLARHVEAQANAGSRIHTGGRLEGDPGGFFFAPVMIEIGGIGELEREVFGPVLHVCRYRAAEVDRVIADINHTGYGLTFGIHSRIESSIEYITRRIRAGNLYVNRNITGAVVGVQPFGGEGLSGTGPKAGGPRYLHRFAVERAISTDTTAAGGNASLLSLDSARRREDGGDGAR